MISNVFEKVLVHLSLGGFMDFLPLCSDLIFGFEEFAAQFSAFSLVQPVVYCNLALMDCVMLTFTFQITEFNVHLKALLLLVGQILRSRCIPG